MALGAFGVHGLRARLSADMVGVWQTAVQYHAWHALELLAVGLSIESPWTKTAGWLLVAGVALFSLSL